MLFDELRRAKKEILIIFRENEEGNTLRKYFSPQKGNFMLENNVQPLIFIGPMYLICFHNFPVMKDMASFRSTQNDLKS